MEGLAFIQQYVDKRACFLPHDKDKKLEPIRAKNDMPKYQVVMKVFFSYTKQQLVQQRSAGERQSGQRLWNNKLRTRSMAVSQRGIRKPPHNGMLNLLQEVPGG